MVKRGIRKSMARQKGAMPKTRSSGPRRRNPKMVVMKEMQEMRKRRMPAMKLSSGVRCMTGPRNIRHEMPASQHTKHEVTMTTGMFLSFFILFSPTS